MTVSNQTLQDAATALQDGKLVSFPTETVYGLGADATNDQSVARIYNAKSRPAFNPLIVHIHDVAQAENYVTIDDHFIALANAFWPGPLTIIAPLKEGTETQNAGISKLVTAGLPTLALRVPAQETARALIAAADRPIAAPSANKSGRISPTTAAHVAADLFDDCAYILDDGPCQAGLESTIIQANDMGWRILRPGPITAEMVKVCLPHLPQLDHLTSPIINDKTPNAPGQLTSHYAPNKPVHLNVTSKTANAIHIGFGPDESEADFNLSTTGDLTEAAANLFAILHLADACDGEIITLSPLPQTGIGVAISDRLSRAAADR